MLASLKETKQLRVLFNLVKQIQQPILSSCSNEA